MATLDEAGVRSSVSRRAEATNWPNLPRRVQAMDCAWATQCCSAKAVRAAGRVLSPAGYQKVIAIMGGDETLKRNMR